MTRKQKSSSWRDWLTFPTPFSYDIDAPIEDVVQALISLEKERGFFNSSSQDISVIPAGDEYQFRFRVRRRSIVSASAEGVIWEDEDGVHIEGETRLNQGILFLTLAPLAFLVLWSLMFLAFSRFSFGLLPIFVIVAVTLSNMYTYQRDRHRVTRELEKGLDQVRLSTHLGKQKNRSTPSQRLSTPSEHQSVWDEAVSEQDDQRRRSR